MSWQDALAALVPPGAAFAGPVDLLAYARDTSVLPPGTPQLVLRPADAAQVAAVLGAASRLRVPVYARGGGSMYAGGVNPHAGGVVLDLSGLDRILEVAPDRGVVVVEAGVRFTRLLAALEPYGQTIGIVPLTAPAGTIGGAINAHALGTGSPRHQSMADEVAGLEVALADGTLLSTGSAAFGTPHFFRQAGGPDLTGLFLGAEGTLGVVTKAAVWLHPAPRVREVLCLGFAEVAHAGVFLTEIQRRELLGCVWYGAGYEQASVRARVKDDPAPPAFVVGLELGGSRAEVDGARARFIELAGHCGGGEYAPFARVYFESLRGEQAHWYTFAGYFAGRRSAILLASLPCEGLPAFVDALARWRGAHGEFGWGGATVLCRRGLHAAVLMFYDEPAQWAAAQERLGAVARELAALGAVPYKSGKAWAEVIQAQGAHAAMLARLKAALDPSGVLGPGNLGLGDPA
jgi:D-lactate dehydrogenase (cytochrome)